METFSVEVKNVKSLARAFRRYPEISGPIMERGIAGAQAALAKHTTRVNVPFRTGNLVQTFRYDMNKLQVRWFPTARYAAFVHGGTGVYGPTGKRIMPRRARALYWKGAQHPVASVRGSRPNPYMPRIAKAARPDIDRVFVQVGEKITDEIARATRLF